MNPMPSGSIRSGVNAEGRIRTCRAAAVVIEDGLREAEEPTGEEAEENIVRGDD
ncbi:hypothetical protein [Streptomyces platensis]|uniref:hypothetical protein n=1 Tax=Streptomyces platensis TaxID=58346 RepID=UPI00378D7614